MFRRNDNHQQTSFWNSVSTLKPKYQQRLDESWAGEFYRQVFLRLDEEPFAVLYADADSRPNTPVNVLLSFEFLKAGFGWSDNETYDHFCFDLQVRYAVGYRDLSESHFELRTVYNFRQRLREYYAATGDDLVERAFEQITDAQRDALGVKATQLRMDSTQVHSNIRNFSRLQLLVEVLHRVRRLLSEVDRQRYDRLLQDYTMQSATHFVYDLSVQDRAQYVQQIGAVMHQLVQELAPCYGDTPTYHLLQRVFDEQYLLEGEDWRPRQPGEFVSGSLCAPDDPEATMRRKRGVVYKGYAVNVTETCAPDNALQLIVKVQTEPNTTSDQRLLEMSLFNLYQRCRMATLYTDGNYNNESIFFTLRGLGVQQWQSGIQGTTSSRYLPLFHYTLQRDGSGQPMSICCPQGQQGAVVAGSRAEQYRAYFDLTQCADCPHADQCLARASSQRRTLSFSAYDLEIAKRRQQIEWWQEEGHNPRSAVESTVWSLVRPFGHQVPVRGRFRTHMLMLGSAVMVNLRRITRWVRSVAPDGASSPARPVSWAFSYLFAQVRRLISPRPLWLSHA